MHIPLTSPPDRNNSQHSSALTVSVDLTEGRITLAGELDRHTAHHLIDAARTLNATPHPRWILDADGLSFLDTTGLRAISACYRMALRRGFEVTLVSADSSLRAALAVLRLDHHLMGSGALRSHPAPLHDRVSYPLAKAADPWAGIGVVQSASAS